MKEELRLSEESNFPKPYSYEVTGTEFEPQVYLPVQPIITCNTAFWKVAIQRVMKETSEQEKKTEFNIKVTRDSHGHD